jgi:hypothetical protein
MRPPLHGVARLRGRPEKTREVEPDGGLSHGLHSAPGQSSLFGLRSSTNNGHHQTARAYLKRSIIGKSKADIPCAAGAILSLPSS